MLPHPSLHPPGTLLEQNTGVKKQTCSPLFLMPRSLTHSHTCTHRHTRRRTTVSSSRATVGLGFIANKGRRKTPPKWERAKLCSQIVASRSAAITKVLAGPPRQGEEWEGLKWETGRLQVSPGASGWGCGPGRPWADN